MRKYIIAIDPGTSLSGICLVRTKDFKPLWCAKIENASVRSEIGKALVERGIIGSKETECVIERMHNPMSADINVFLTCEWIGRFDVFMNEITGCPTQYVFRHQEYKNLCANIYDRNDKGVRMALIERFAYGEPNYGKGTKKAPGWFFGFAADAWSVYAIAVTHIDLRGDSNGDQEDQ